MPELMTEMKSLSKQLDALDDQHRRETRERYAAILERADAPQDGDAAAALALAKELGITAADVGRHLEIRRIDATIASQITDAADQQKLDARAAAAHQTLETAKEQWREKLERLTLASNEAQAAADSAERRTAGAKMKRERLRQECPTAFGLPPYVAPTIDAPGMTVTVTTAAKLTQVENFTPPDVGEGPTAMKYAVAEPVPA